MHKLYFTKYKPSGHQNYQVIIQCLSNGKRNKLESEDDDRENYLVTKPKSKCKLGREVDGRIFTYVSDLVPFSTAKFGILQLGPLCNAAESCSFTEANCNVKTVMNENDLALILEFNQLFSKGVQLLSDLKRNTREFEEHELAAIRILDDFFKEKGIKLCQLFFPTSLLY